MSILYTHSILCQVLNWLPKLGSNQQQSASEAGALPIELLGIKLEPLPRIEPGSHPYQGCTSTSNALAANWYSHGELNPSFKAENLAS